MFSKKEVEYLKSQRIVRITTAASVASKEERENVSIQPDVVPVVLISMANTFMLAG
jgi:hypothetical protein